MESELRSHLTSCAKAFAERRKLEMSTVARLAAGDWRFFDRLDSGTSFTARKYDAVIGWFSTNWPDDAEWPRGVPRPETEAAV